MAIAAALFHVVGLCVGGLGLKKLGDFLLLVTIWSSIAVQFLGVTVYSNPLSSPKLRRFADVSLDVFLKTIYLPLSTCHILRLNQPDGAVLYTFILISLIAFLIHSTTRRFTNLLNVIVVAQFSVAFFYSLNMNADNDNYWLEYFLVLFIINHFGLPKLSQIFSIPASTLSSVSLVFLNLFLINAFSF